MKYNNIAYLLLLLLLFSCSNRKQRIEKDVIKFTSSQVYFPFDTADIRIMGSVLLCCKPNNWSIF